jgi:hypothetical protein
MLYSTTNIKNLALQHSTLKQFLKVTMNLILNEKRLLAGL